MRQVKYALPVIMAIMLIPVLFLLTSRVDKELRKDEIKEHLLPIDEPLYSDIEQVSETEIRIIMVWDDLKTKYEYTCELQPDMMMVCTGHQTLGSYPGNEMEEEWNYEKW